MIERNIKNKFLALSKKFPIISVLGPRQSGKSTLAKQTFPKKKYLSFEDLDNRESANSDPRGFLERYKDGAIFDEAHLVPQLFSYLQTNVDEDNRDGKFILTGSHNYLLHEKVSQSLAGRTAILTLLPFSVAELKKVKNLKLDLDDLMFKGGYPRIYDKKLEPGEWYPDYIATYVERDLRTIKNISDLSVFQKFLKLCAGRVGQVLSLQSIGNECGISHNTVRSWISILESSYIIFLLQPYYKNFNKRVLKSPKLYFYDTGLLCQLLGIQNKEQLSSHYARGSIFESFVISNYYKSQFNKAKRPNCYYWRDSRGNEIDLIIEEGAKLIPVEIKSSKTISGDYFNGLEYFSKIAKKYEVEPYLVYGGLESQKYKQMNVISWIDVEKVLKGT